MLTGDLVSDKPNVEAVEKFVAGLTPKLGTYFTLGNWEHWRPSSLVEKLTKRQSVHFLLNQSVKIADEIQIVGLDDEAGEPDELRAFSAVDQSLPTLLLFHSPITFELLKSRFEIALAGHTHGGQIRFPFLGPLWLPNGSHSFVSGFYEKAGQKMYVSRGIGTSILPIRFNCRPEIAVFDFVPNL